jgi:hypothetical protein
MLQLIYQKTQKQKLIQMLRGITSNILQIFQAPIHIEKKKMCFKLQLTLESLKGKLEPLMPLTRCTFQSRKNIKKNITKIQECTWGYIMPLTD